MSQNDNPYISNTYGGGAYQSSASYGHQDHSQSDVKSSDEDLTNQAMLSNAPAIIDTTTATFADDVIAESANRPVIVDFWAPWCGPCKQLTPIIESAVQNANGAVKLAKMNIDEHPEIAGQMGVQSIPAVVAFVNGQPVDGFMGAQGESQIKAFIEKLSAGNGSSGADTQIEQLLAQAETLLNDGATDQAVQAFSVILQHMPNHPKAVSGIVNCMLALGEVADAARLLDQLPQDDKSDPEIESAIKRVQIAQEVAELGDPKKLSEMLDSNPNDHDARSKLAKIYSAMGERDQAVDALIYIMRADRQWEDDGARKLLLDFFEAWGAKDPATLSGRRKLSSILFS